MTPLLDERGIVAAAQDRATVRLTDGRDASLVSWGTRQGRNRCRVEFEGGRTRTIRKTDVEALIVLAVAAPPGHVLFTDPLPIVDPQVSTSPLREAP